MTIVSPSDLEAISAKLEITIKALGEIVEVLKGLYDDEDNS